MAKKATVTPLVAHTQALAAALKVLMLTPATAAWLQANDPKAFAQAGAALGLTGADLDALTRPVDESVPDFVVTQEGSVFTFSARHDQARDFAMQSIGAEPWQWLGTHTFAVDHRLAPELCYQLREDGFTVVVR